MIINSCDYEAIQISAHMAIECFIDAMRKEGVITKEQRDEMDKYSVTLVKKGVLRSIFYSVFKWNDSQNYWVTTKIVS